MNHTTVTRVYNKCSNEGKRALHLVLKRKTQERIIIEEIEKELEIHFLQIQTKLQNTKFDDPEKALRAILLQAIVSILEGMIKKYFGELSKADQDFIKEIMNEEEKKKQEPNKDNNQEPKNQNIVNNNYSNHINTPNQINQPQEALPSTQINNPIPITQPINLNQQNHLIQPEQTAPQNQTNTPQNFQIPQANSTNQNHNHQIGIPQQNKSF